MYTRPNISALVAGQLPEFIQEDYQTFVSFLEAYYEYLDNNVKSDYKSLRDIDNTLDGFIQYFRHELSNFTTNAASDERFLLQHLKDYYTAKGSEASYKFLFRILFNSDVEIRYPKEYIFRASDGRWNQDTSILLSQDQGNIFDIVGKGITVINRDNQQFTIFANRIKTLVINDNTFYEVFLDKFYYGTLYVGDIVSYDGFVGTIQKTANKFNILKRGSGFKVGQIFDINSETGSGLKVKVTKVGPNGELLNLQPIKFGAGYIGDFFVLLVSGYGSSLYEPNKKYSSTGGFIDYGNISKQTYFSGTYTDVNYCGEVLQTFYTDTRIPQDGSVYDETKTAVIELKIGAIQKYPGYYTAVNGFLSDSMRLQDSKYYQISSYVIKVNKSIESYRSIVKSVIHPAGLALFGEYSLTNTFDLTASVQMVIRYLTANFNDSVQFSDLNRKSIGKSLADSFSVNTSISSALYKSLSDAFILSDNSIFQINKSINDSINFSDQTTSNISKNIVNDSTTISESLISIINKVLADSVTISDNPSMNLMSMLSDSFTASDSGSIRLDGFFLQDYSIDYAPLTTTLQTF